MPGRLVRRRGKARWSVAGSIGRHVVLRAVRVAMDRVGHVPMAHVALVGIALPADQREARVDHVRPGRAEA